MPKDSHFHLAFLQEITTVVLRNFPGKLAEEFSASFVILNICRGKQCRQGIQQPRASSVIFSTLTPLDKTTSVLWGPYCFIDQADNEDSNDHLLKHFEEIRLWGDTGAQKASLWPQFLKNKKVIHGAS